MAFLITAYQALFVGFAFSFDVYQCPVSSNQMYKILQEINNYHAFDSHQSTSQSSFLHHFSIQDITYSHIYSGIERLIALHDYFEMWYYSKLQGDCV
mgnify:CR=1 FL=1